MKGGGGVSVDLLSLLVLALQMQTHTEAHIPIFNVNWGKDSSSSYSQRYMRAVVRRWTFWYVSVVDGGSDPILQQFSYHFREPGYEYD